MATVGKYEELVIDENVRFSIRFIWDAGEPPGSVTFEGKEIVSHVEGDNGPEDIEYEALPMFDGFIKWDNCMEIHNFNHHWCGHNNMAQDIVDMIYKKAAEIMKKTG